MLKESDKALVRKEFESLSGAVKLIDFTQEYECDYCGDTTQMLKDVAELSDRISLETFDFVRDKEIVDKHKVDKIPAIVVTGDVNGAIRFFGIPSGYEFISLMDAIKMASSGDSGLDIRTKETLKRMKKSIHLQVFVTPT